MSDASNGEHSQLWDTAGYNWAFRFNCRTTEMLHNRREFISAVSTFAISSPAFAQQKSDTQDTGLTALSVVVWRE